MKKILAIILLYIVGVGLLYTSCIKDRCKDVVCRNGGVCVDAVCACATGYEGANCDKKWNEKFLGVWKVADSIYKDNVTRFHYDIAITRGITKDSFYVSGLTDTLNDSTVLCVRTAPRAFNIVNDRKLDSVLTIKSGSGIMDSITGVITGKYTFQRKDTMVTVGFKWTK